MRKISRQAAKPVSQAFRLDHYPKIIVLAFVFLSHTTSALGYELAEDPHTAIPCQLTLWETPFNSTAKAWPSMNQSSELSTCVYALGHRTIPVLMTGNPSSYSYSLGVGLAIVGFDLLMTWLPPGNAWLHEEWHRAVMAQRGIGSYNEVYNFDIGAESIKVSHVTDAQLTQLKKDHNPDMVRLAAAGAEAETELSLSLQKMHFARDLDVTFQSIYIFNTLQTGFYIASGSDKTPDDLKDESHRQDPSQKERDFVGHDFTSWVYDLFRPDEPYAARGTYPGGDGGVDRYRGRQDLSGAEKRYLRLQGVLTWLNLIDPFLWGKNSFRMDGTGERRWNARLVHHLTSFGTDIQVPVFLASEAGAFVTALHTYTNGSRSFFGLEWQALSAWRWAGLQWEPRIMLWEQPHRQKFRTHTGQVGGLGSLTVRGTLTASTHWFTALTGKSAGWVAGNPYLDRNLMWQMGIGANL